MKPNDIYDLVIIGGGINGTGIARDAAGRGLKVLLAESDDLASATSSASTKLIHGGLRYLEYFEFRLVSEALAEREVLLSIAPHIVWPLEFVLPHESHLRPAWMIRAGLFLYDHLGARARRSSLPKSRSVTARALVNAAGPWVRSVLDHELGIASPGRVRLVKGSHIVVPRIHEKRHAFILQNPDRRVIFLIPYERAHTLIGTTDVPAGDAEKRPAISDEETRYLCAAASRYTERALTPDEIVWSYSGVRPLYDDGSANPSAVTRDYHLVVDTGGDSLGAPLLSVFGGKITTYRKLAEHAMEKLEHVFPGKRAWTATEPLPGGDFGGNNFTELLAELARDYPRISQLLLARLLRRHGTLATEILGKAEIPRDLGEDFGGGLYEAEVRYLVEHEWAREADDVLWRRTKAGLHMSERQRERLADHMKAAA